MQFLKYMEDTLLWVVATFENIPQDDNFMNIFKTANGVLAMALFAVGLFYCLVGMIFRKISIGSFLSVLVFALLKDFNENVDVVAKPINGFFLDLFTENVKSHLPKTINELVTDTRVFIGYLVLSLIISVILSFFVPVCKFFSLAAFFYFLQKELAGIFSGEKDDFAYTYLLVALALTFVAYLVIEQAEYVALIIVLSFVGSTIVLLGCSQIFKYPENFAEFIKTMFNNKVIEFKTVNFIYLLLLSSFCICIQHAFNKNKS